MGRGWREDDKKFPDPQAPAVETKTEIHLPGRSWEPILDIKIGNKVYACLADTGTTYSTLTNLPESSKVTGKVNVVVLEGKQVSV